MRPGQLKRLAAVGGGKHLKAFTLEVETNHLQDIRLIVDQ
jgi:hypothetical protein